MIEIDTKYHTSKVIVSEEVKFFGITPLKNVSY
jgi:hypothetical protein